MSAENEVIDNETGLAVPPPAAVAPAMSKAKAQKCVNNIHSAIGSLRANIADLWEGRGWESLGFETWYDMTYSLFGLSDRQTRYLKESAIVERQTVPLLAPPEVNLLSRLPDDGVQAIKHLGVDERAMVIGRLSQLDNAPTLRDVLEAIPSSLLLPKQVVQLEKLREKDIGLFVNVDYKAEAHKKLEQIEKLYTALNDLEYFGALDYATFDDMIRQELPFFGAIFNPVVGRAPEWEDEDDSEDF